MTCSRERGVQEALDREGLVLTEPLRYLLIPSLFWKASPSLWVALCVNTSWQWQCLTNAHMFTKHEQSGSPCWCLCVAPWWRFLLELPHRLLWACKDHVQVSVSGWSGWHKLQVCNAPGAARLGVEDAADDALPRLVFFLRHRPLGAKTGLLFVSHDCSHRKILFTIRLCLLTTLVNMNW